MEEIVHALGIEWKHLLAQVINFGILTFVLFKLVYKPLLKVIDERIEKTKEADQKSSSIEEKLLEIKNLEKKTLDEARSTSKQILAQAENNALLLAKKLEDETNLQIKKISEQEAKKLEEGRAQFFSDLKKETVGIVAVALEKAIKENLDEATKTKITQSAIKEIEHLTNKS